MKKRRTIHKLKIAPNYFENLQTGRKRVEIRFNDRDYQVGDWLEFSDEHGRYWYEITHIHSGLGMQHGYVALSVQHMQGMAYFTYAESRELPR